MIREHLFDKARGLVNMILYRMLAKLVLVILFIGMLWPAWSPDDNQLAFGSEPSGHMDI